MEVNESNITTPLYGVVKGQCITFGGLAQICFIHYIYFDVVEVLDTYLDYAFTKTLFRMCTHLLSQPQNCFGLRARVDAEQ